MTKLSSIELNFLILSYVFFVILSLQFAVLDMITFLQFKSVSGLPIATNDLGGTISLPNPPRPKCATGCKCNSKKQLIRKLNKLGAIGGGYNGRYMAFTWNEATKFPSLVATVNKNSSNVSLARIFPRHAPTRPATITSRANCYTTQNRLLRMCSVCSAVTFLGNDRVPSFINEVTCGQASCTCSNKVIGTCQNAVMHQQFFNRTGRCDPRTGYEELLPYTQAIRVGCECMVFSV